MNSFFNIDNLELFSYSVPFKNPITIKKQKIGYREGFFLKISSGDKDAFGEIAPLPGFGNSLKKDIKQQYYFLKQEILYNKNSLPHDNFLECISKTYQPLKKNPYLFLLLKQL